MTITKTINQGLFSEQGKIKAIDQRSGDAFGYSVDISGDWAIVGAYGKDTGGSDAGAAYIFQYRNGHWSQKQKLQASDPQAGDYFGYSVAISGDWAIVGAELEDTGGTQAGAAYIFHCRNGHWSQTQKLQADDKQSTDYFGHSVDISGDKAIVGAWGEDVGRTVGTNAGAAYIFHCQNGHWSQTKKLQASDRQGNDYFGTSVGISGDKAIVGAEREDTGGGDTGAAYIFQYQNGNWSQTQKLQASDKQKGDYFGYSVAINGDRAVVGAYFEDTGGTNAGAAYIFQYHNGNWSQTQKLQASDKQAHDHFGHSVGISGDRVIVGAYAQDTGGTNAGAAYIFQPQNGNWSQTQKLQASDKQAGDMFGYSVGISGDRAIVGASYLKDTGINAANTAYIFQSQNRHW